MTSLETMPPLARPRRYVTNGGTVHATRAFESGRARCGLHVQGNWRVVTAPLVQIMCGHCRRELERDGRKPFKQPEVQRGSE